jgi:hypothetical protein
MRFVRCDRCDGQAFIGHIRCTVCNGKGGKWVVSKPPENPSQGTLKTE